MAPGPIRWLAAARRCSLPGSRFAPSATATGWSVLCDVASDSLGARAGVPFQRANGGLPRSGEQDWRVGPVLGRMGQRGVPQLVEGPPTSSFTEQLSGPAARQSGATGDWTP